MKRLLLAIAALATLPAAHAQTHEVALAGVWHIMSSANECTALYHYDDQDILAALIYPRPGKKPDAALMFKSSRLVGDAKDHEPYPVRLVLGDDNGFDTGFQDVVPTGFTLSPTEHGIRIAAPAQAFGDSLAKAQALRLEGMGRGTLSLEVRDMEVMIDALRKCIAASAAP
jgi:hypothetical protein